MANKITTTYASEIESATRLEPRFFYNQSLLKRSFDEFGYEEINDFATLRSGSTPEHHEDRKDADDYYFIKSADVKRYNLNFSTISFLSSEIHKSRLKFRVIPDDILLSNTGKYLGFACIIPQTLEEGSTNQNIIRIRFKGKHLSKFNPHFLLAFFNSQFGQVEIEALLTLTGQKYLNMEKFRNYKVPKFNNKTIDEVSLKIKNAESNGIKALSLLEEAKNIFYQKLNIDFSEIKKEIFYSANLSSFSEADLWSPNYSYPLYVSTAAAIQKKWKTILLGEITTIRKGDEVGSDNYNLYLGKKESDIPFIRTSDFINYEVDQFPDFFIPEEIYRELKQDIKAGDVLFTKDGKVGMTAMLTENDRAIIGSGIVRLRPKTEARKYNLSSEYLFLTLSLKETGLYPAIRRTVIASTLPHLREDRLREFEIPILDKNSIDNITKLIKEAFELKNEKKKLIREAREEIDNYFDI